MSRHYAVNADVWERYTSNAPDAGLASVSSMPGGMPPLLDRTVSTYYDMTRMTTRRSTMSVDSMPLEPQQRARWAASITAHGLAASPHMTTAHGLGLPSLPCSQCIIPASCCTTCHRIAKACRMVRFDPALTSLLSYKLGSTATHIANSRPACTTLLPPRPSMSHHAPLKYPPTPHHPPTPAPPLPAHRSIFGLTTIDPHSGLARSWSYLMLCMDGVYTAFLVPISSAFFLDKVSIHPFAVIDLLAGCIFLINLFLGFQTGLILSHDYKKKLVGGLGAAGCVWGGWVGGWGCMAWGYASCRVGGWGGGMGWGDRVGSGGE